MVAVAALVGTLLLLSVTAVTRAELRVNDVALINRGMLLLLLSAGVAMALPVLMLASTAGRLSASLRDRRLANLRLLGLSQARTRAVAAVETGVAAIIGSVGGVIAFAAARPLLVRFRPDEREWTTDTLRLAWFDQPIVVILVTVVMVVVAALPQRLDSRRLLTLAAHAGEGRPRMWRLLPLISGVALSGFVLFGAQARQDNSRLAPFMLVGLALLGIGAVAVVPIFVRLVADGAARQTRPTLLIAGRRLQSQPAAMTRVVAVLLVGLFVVAGARGLVVAFEQTPQYKAETRMMTTGQRAAIDAASRTEAVAVQTRLRDIEGVAATVVLPTLTLACPERRCPTAVAVSCAELRALPGPLRSCTSKPTWIRSGTGLDEQAVLRWHALSDGQISEAAVAVPAPRRRSPQLRGLLEPIYADVVLGADTPGLMNLLSDTRTQVLIVALPGYDVADMIRASVPGRSFTMPVTGYYEFVTGLRSLVWGVAGVILSVGLLAFAMAAFDRSVTRRAEVAGLRLLGVSPRVLRRIHWVETALPLGLGTVLATGLGLLAGSTYLAYAGILQHTPWRQTVALGLVGLAGACLATVLIVAANPRLRPEDIRAE